MRKMLYQQLTDFVLNKLPEAYHAKFYSEMDKGKIKNEGRTLTESGIEIAHIEYDAILFFEELPFKKIDPLNLIALISIWLDEVSKSEEYYRLVDYQELDFELELIDDETADLTFVIPFKEPITAIKSESGKLMIENEAYELGEVTVDIAESIDVKVVIDNG